MQFPPSPTVALYFVRHGATSANQAGLRCGGDLDLPLTDDGRRQACEAALHLPRLSPPVGLIVSSDLRRTRETATILAATQPGVPVRVQPALGERRLGEWNLRPIDETQPWLDARITPPGGESEAEFEQRIRTAVQALAPQLHAAHMAGTRVLLVGSKGVARMLGQLSGQPGHAALGNSELATFHLPIALLQPAPAAPAPALDQASLATTGDLL